MAPRPACGRQRGGRRAAQTTTSQWQAVWWPARGAECDAPRRQRAAAVSTKVLGSSCSTVSPLGGGGGEEPRKRRRHAREASSGKVLAQSSAVLGEDPTASPGRPNRGVLGWSRRRVGEEWQGSHPAAPPLDGDMPNGIRGKRHPAKGESLRATRPAAAREWDAASRQIGITWIPTWLHAPTTAHNASHGALCLPTPPRGAYAQPGGGSLLWPSGDCCTAANPPKLPIKPQPPAHGARFAPSRPAEGAASQGPRPAEDARWSGQDPHLRRRIWARARCV